MKYAVAAAILGLGLLGCSEKSKPNATPAPPPSAPTGSAPGGAEPGGVNPGPGSSGGGTDVQPK
jgi:hypothetical protein